MKDNYLDHLEHHLFLLMLNLSQMSGQDQIINIFIESINSLSKDFHILFSDLPANNDRDVINIETVKNTFGHIELIPTDGHIIDKTTKALLRNSVGMLALFLEKQTTDNLLADEKQLLETIVFQRTKELEDINKELKKEIYERSIIEKKLKESKYFVQQILETTPNLLYIYNLIEKKNEYANLELFEMLGYKNDEIKKFGSDLNSKIFHPEDMKLIADHHKKLHLSETEMPFEIIFRAKHNDGSWRWLRSKDIPFERSSDGKVIKILGISEDITERINSQKDKERFEEQLRQSQKMESIGQLAGGVAHDFNNMLGVILGYTELALAQLVPTQALFKNLVEIRNAATRSAGITRQLLAFARKQTVSPKILDLNETVEGMLKMLRRLIGEQIDLSWQPGQALWSIKIDPSQIDQILANLCVNARDSIDDIGKLTVETSNSIIDAEYCNNSSDIMPGEYVKLSVSDNGHGMEKETISHIFEPFYTTKRIGEGTGLGLATVYGIVKQNNGFINVQSDIGIGTVFEIYLPKIYYKSEQLKDDGQVLQYRKGNETILIVEDEQMVGQMTKEILEQLGYSVLLSENPKNAIQLIEDYDGPIDLLLSDVIMPDMNGLDLAERICTAYPTIKCLFMSGYTANVLAKQELHEKKVLFIQKPFTKKELASKVREALEIS